MAPGWLGYIGDYMDEMLPSLYRDFFIIHDKDPYKTASIMEL